MNDKEKENSIILAFYYGVFAMIPTVIAVAFVNSLTLTVELLIEITSAGSHLFSWYALRKVRQGITSDFNYGYGKLENITGLIVAVSMMLAVAGVGFSAIERIYAPETLTGSGIWFGLGQTIVLGCVDIWFLLRYYRLAKKENSPIFDAQWRLLRADVTANIFIIVSLGLSLTFAEYRWSQYIDPIFSFILVGFLVVWTYRILIDSVGELLDKTLEEQAQIKILRHLADYFDEYIQFHGLRSRRAGGKIYIELFLEFDGNRSMADVQTLLMTMTHDLQARIPGSEVVIAPRTEKVQ